MANCPHLDKIFGLNGSIARRDFLAGMLVARHTVRDLDETRKSSYEQFHYVPSMKAYIRDALRNGPFGKISFSHADLTRVMDHWNMFRESHQAVGQLLGQVRT